MYSQVVPVVCPTCDAEPPVGVTAGAACIACQSPLIAVSEPENLVGTVIDGRFEIVDRLGAGGMGTVYRARQRSIGRDVALKVIDRLFEADVTAVKRFMREAQVASALVHPNTVGVIEFGQSTTGRLYLVMELVRGKTLKDATDASAFEVARVLRIGVQLCDALEAAHALGIIHRDLKLENVMLLDGPNDRDHVKILDFGLARRAEETSRATATGLVAGTPRYLAPEVALQNAEPAPPQDMYALGVLLGEMASGQSLWEGPTLEALFTAKLTTLPKLETVQPALRSVILRLLDRDPANRPTAAATRDALLAIGAPLRATAKPIPASMPGTIDTSMPLDTVALDAVTGGPPSAAPAAPPVAPTPRSGDAFEPPRADGEKPLELDSKWQQEKAAKANFANQPPPRRPFKLWGFVIAVALVAIVATAVVKLGTSAGEVRTPRAHPLPETANTVSIEIRTRPPGQIVIDGRNAGTAPVTLHVTKGTKPLNISTSLEGHPFSRSIVPDRDQTIDFTYP